MLIRIADCLDVPLDDLVGRSIQDEPKLTANEKTLLTAARNADERARQDALHMLSLHAKELNNESLV